MENIHSEYRGGGLALRKDDSKVMPRGRVAEANQKGVKNSLLASKETGKSKIR